MRKYFVFFLIASALLSCKKHDQQKGCLARACTLEFASITVRFVTKDGLPTPGKNVTVINLRTHDAIIAKGSGIIVPSIGPNLFTLATDNNKSEFSTEGDDVELTATDVVTNITKTARFKISGGCNCHISKISGPDEIVFN